MRTLKFAVDHEGCKAGDVVRFESAAEAEKLVADAKAVEVRFDDESKDFVVVNRQSAEVADNLKLAGK